MKKFIIYFLACLLIQFGILLGKIEIEISMPLNVHFNGIVIRGDTIIAYGSVGTFIISVDKGVNWTQNKIPSSSNIIKMFWEENQLTAFNENGEILTSKSYNDKWEMAIDLKDSILTVIKMPTGYFIRCRNLLNTLSFSLSQKNSYHLTSEYFPKTDDYLFKYQNSISFMNNMLIAESDSAKFMIFDENLKLLREISLEKSGLCSPCVSSYQIFSYDNVFYFKNGYNLYRTNDFDNLQAIYHSSEIFNCKLFNGTIYFLKSNSIYNYDLPDDHVSVYKLLEPDSVIISSKFNIKELTFNIKYFDYQIVNDKILFIGKNKFISINKSNDSVLNIISDFSGFSNKTVPDKINDSTLLYCRTLNYGYNNFLYKTGYQAGVVLPFLDKNLNTGAVFNNDLQFKYFDNINKTLILGAHYKNSFTGGIFKSDGTLKHLIKKDLPSIMFNFNIEFTCDGKLSSFPCFQHKANRFNLETQQKLPDNFIFATNIFDKTFFYTFNSDFDLVSYMIDDYHPVDYFYSYDTNIFITHAYNKQNLTYEFRYTKNKGKTWDIIKTFSKDYRIISFNTLSPFSDSLVIFAYYKYSDSTTNFYLLNLKKRTIDSIYQINNSIYNKETDSFYYGFTADSSKIYISILDTLFITDDLMDRMKWKYIIFPDNGKIISTFQKFDSSFYARYTDDRHPDNIYWLKITEIPSILPIIDCSDLNFGEIDILTNTPISKKFTIKNTSKDAELIISNVSNMNNKEFFTDLPKIDDSNPLLIKANDSSEFNIYFKPLEKRKYKDSLIFSSNAIEIDSICIFQGEGIDTTELKVVDTELGIDYLYAFPPKPLPAKKSVRTLIYWSTNIKFDINEIIVVDINGYVVSHKDQISIDPLTSYSAYLKWDCSGVIPGIYLIKIRHGSQSSSIKVVVE